MASEAQLRANEKWQKKNTKSVCLRFMPSTMDAYEWLQMQPNKTAYIVKLVRADMACQNVPSDQA